MCNGNTLPYILFRPRADAHCTTQLRHNVRSSVTSPQSSNVIDNACRSVSVLFQVTRLRLLRLTIWVYFSTRLGGLLSSILCTCPNHCSRVLRMISSSSVLVLRLMSSLRTLSLHIIANILRSLLVLALVSAAYRNFDKTRASNKLVFIFMPILLFFSCIDEFPKYAFGFPYSRCNVLFTATVVGENAPISNKTHPRYEFFPPALCHIRYRMPASICITYFVMPMPPYRGH